MLRGVATAVVVLLGVLPSASAAPVEFATRDAALAAAVERATRENKPVLLFSRPAVCRAPKKGLDPCRALEDAVRHPAIQRRFERVVYVKVDSEDASASVSVLDPGGSAVVRWPVPPDQSTFRQMLTLVDGAAQHVVAAYHAREEGKVNLAAREESLAKLALGDEAAGRAGLEAMRSSEDAESRELATIWLGRLAARGRETTGLPSGLDALARGGSTSRVCFEAWMAIGDHRQEERRSEDAIAAYREALELAAESGSERDAVHAALARSAESSSPVIGLGAPGSIVAGLRTLQPRWSLPQASRVEYRIDGRIVATAVKPPFVAAVTFDRIPTRRLLEVVAYDRKGAVLRSASVVVNDRSGAFAIQIAEPASETLSGASPVELSLRAPRGRSVEEVVVEWNGAVVARLDAPPWKAEVDAAGGELGILRAVVRLDDGQEREDVRVFNAGAMLLGTGVHLVEVPVNASNRSLKKEDVVVKEGGVARPVDRVIAASDASLDVALLLDMSTSMKAHVLDLEEAALQFVGKGLGGRARATIVAFDSRARIALWPTGDRAPVERAIQQLRVRGATALYDAIITSILQLQAGGARRAIVVLSDGFDNSSIFSMGDVLEVAKRNAVPVYVVTLNPVFQDPPGRDMPTIQPEAKAQRELARLARASGGIAFELRDVEKAGAIWQKIADDLRNQSLVIYRTSGGSGGWRKLDVSLKSGGTVRAPEGVFVDAGGTEGEQAK